MKKTTALLLVIACILLTSNSLMAQTMRPYPISFNFYKVSLPINDNVNAIDGQYSGVANAAIVQDSVYRVDYWTGSARITNLNAPVDSNSILTALYGYGGLLNGGDVTVAGKTVTQNGDSAFILEYIAPSGWINYSLPNTNIDISKIDVYGSNFVVFCSQFGLGGEIITTKNASSTWHNTSLHTDIKHFTDADFNAINNAVAVGIKDSITGEGVITYSSDTGNTWYVGATTPNSLLCVKIYNDTVVYAGDSNGKIWVSENLGQSWSDTLTLPVTTPIHDLDIFYAYPGPAFIAISDTSVIYSEDTAKTWHIDPTYTHTEKLRNIHTFEYNTLHAFFIGAENGTLFFHEGFYESIEEENLISFDLYPNPANEQTLIKAETVITNVEILDIFGRKVLSTKPNSKTHNLNLSSLASGNYIIHITTKQGYGVQKFVKN